MLYFCGMFKPLHSFSTTCEKKHQVNLAAREQEESLINNHSSLTLVPGASHLTAPWDGKMRGPGNDLREIGFSSEIQRFSCRIGRRGSLMVRSLDSRLSGTSLRPGRGHVILLLSRHVSLTEFHFT